MVASVKPGWLRAAALAILASWLPCLPLGLCAVRASAQSVTHHCCGQPAVKMAASPQDCWVQSSPTTPPGAMPSVLGAPAARAVQARPVAETATLQETRPAQFSPLAIVLRI
jgi:hypothetical protein